MTAALAARVLLVVEGVEQALSGEKAGRKMPAVVTRPAAKRRNLLRRGGF
jgi:hypothetical protein